MEVDQAAAAEAEQVVMPLRDRIETRGGVGMEDALGHAEPDEGGQDAVDRGPRDAG